MINAIKRFLRWLLNKDELESIRKELVLLRLVLVSEIERKTPKRNEPVGPLKPVRGK
jgi:hypothetical protein